MHARAWAGMASGLLSVYAFTTIPLAETYALIFLAPLCVTILSTLVLKETVGSQDQVLAAHGGFNHITFLPNGEVVVRPVTVGAARLHELESHMMLFYTGIKRTASTIADTFVPSIDAKRRQLRFMKDMVDEGLSILSGDVDLSAFGQLLHEAWDAKRSLSNSVSNADVDAMYESARRAGLS